MESSPYSPLCLAIETSCDDTSVALVRSDGFVLDMLNADQSKDHLPFGGVVPEIASRNHTFYLLPLIDQLLQKNQLSFQDLLGIAVTSRPGLVGSLLVGVITAKTLSLCWKVPFVGVNHLEGHILAPWLRDKRTGDKANNCVPSLSESLPGLVLAVSGGHTHLCLVEKWGEYKILGQSIDDAAGEALDKFAKELGLGFPGGNILDQWARKGQPDRFSFAKGLSQKGLNFSFSGTKSSALRLLETLSSEEITESVSDLCASFEKSVVDILFEKLERAYESFPVQSVAITGGVSANTYLRQKAQDWGKEKSMNVLIPPLRYCTDNAAMIGFAGGLRLMNQQVSDQSHKPSPRSFDEDFSFASLS